MIKKIMIVVVAFLALAACTTTKNGSTSNTKMESSDTSEDTAAVQKENTTSTQSKSTSKDNSNAVATQANGSTGAMNNLQASNNTGNSAMDYNAMFAKLNMTDDQINRFRMGMRDFQQKRMNTANGEMMGSIESERTRQLEAILSKVQLENYQQWNADNN